MDELYFMFERVLRLFIQILTMAPEIFFVGLLSWMALLGARKLVRLWKLEFVKHWGRK